MTTTPTPTVAELALTIKNTLDAMAEETLLTARQFADALAERYVPLADALRALEPPTPVLPPIPEPGVYLDKDGTPCHIEGPYVQYLGQDNDEHWSTAHTSGPFTRLMPATDVVDAGIVRELLRQAHADSIRLHDLRQHAEAFANCVRPDCADRRALLVRAEGATGGGR